MMWALWLGLIGLGSVVVGRWLMPRMVTWSDESSCVTIGARVIRGQHDLWGDDSPGHRMPGAYWWVGLSQCWGRSLWIARCWGLVTGFGVVLLAGHVGWRLGGPEAGVAAALLLAMQSTVVGYFATGTYLALTNLLVLGGVALILAPPWHVAGMAAIGALFVVRTNLWVMIPVVLAWAVWRTPGDWAALLGVTSAWPVLFFAMDWRRHRKVLAYVPGLRWLARRWGFAPIASLLPIPHTGTVVEGMWLLIRRYEAWWALLGVLLLYGRGPGLGPDTLGIGMVLTATFLLHLPQSWHRPKVAVGYLTSYVALWPVVLGVAVAPIIRATGWLGWLLVCAVGAWSLLAIRHPLVVRDPVVRGRWPLADLDAAVEQLDRSVAGGPIFLIGLPMALYLAGRDPEPRQSFDVDTLAPAGDPAVIHRMGLTGAAEIDAALGVDGKAQIAVIDPEVLAFYWSGRAGLVMQIDQALRAQFRRVAVVRAYRWSMLEVWRRV